MPTVQIVVQANTAGAQASMAKLATETNKAKTASEGAATSMGKVGKASSAAGSQLASMVTRTSASIAALGPLGLAGVALGAAAGIDKLATRSLHLRDVQGALKISIDKARAASNGLIDNYTLETNAVMALRFGIVRTDKDYAKLVKTATLLARTTGQEVGQAVDDLTRGLARQSPMILDNLGIMVDVEATNKAAARALGKTVDKLSEAERKTAFFNAAMADAEKKTNGLKVATDGWAVSLGQAKVVATNLLDDIIKLPENISALNQELKRTGETGEAASTALEIFGRVGLAALTFGASEAIMALAPLISDMQYMEAFAGRMTLGDKKGSVGLSGLRDVNKKIAQKAIDDAAPGMAVTLGLLDSIAAGTRAQEEYERKHHKAAKKRHDETQELAKHAYDLEMSRQKAREDNWNRLHEMAKNNARDREEFFEIEDLRFSEALERGKQLQAMNIEHARNDKLRSIESTRVGAANQGPSVGDQMGAKFGFGGSGEHEAELARIQQTRNAELSYLDAVSRATNDSLELQQLEEDRKVVWHQADMARMAEEMAMREETIARQEAAGKVAGDTVGGLAASWVAAGDLSAKGFRKVLKEWGKAESLRLTGVAISEGVQALVSLAFFNYPQAALHGAAAVSAGIGAASIAALTGAAGGFGGGGRAKSVGGFSGSDFGGGPAQPATNDKPSTTNSQADTVPTSPQEAAQQAGSSGSSAGGVHYHFAKGSVMTMGTIDEKTGLKIGQGVDAARRRLGKTGS